MYLECWVILHDKWDSVRLSEQDPYPASYELTALLTKQGQGLFQHYTTNQARICGAFSHESYHCIEYLVTLDIGLSFSSPT